MRFSTIVQLIYWYLTDLRYIKALLEHQPSKTTMIYTHVRTEALDRITSPLDSLYGDEDGIVAGANCSCMHAKCHVIGTKGVDVNELANI